MGFIGFLKKKIQTLTNNSKQMIIGQTYSGRFLAIFLAPREKRYYFVVTAREATDAERGRLYK